MRTADKVLLVLLALVNYALAVLVILAEFIQVNLGVLEDMLSFPAALGYNGTLEAVIYIVFIAAALIVGTSLLVIVSRSANYRPVNRNDTISICDDGSMEITYEALRVMSKKKCMTYRFVVDCSTDVDAAGGELTLFVKLRPTPDTVLTDALAQLKKELAENIENQTGLAVKKIKILVLPYKTRKNQ